MSAIPVLQQDNLVIYELLGSDDAPRIEQLLKLYADSFPQYTQYLPRMRRRSAFPSDHNPRFRTHYWLVEVNGQPAALRTFRYVRARRCGLAHALAVHPDYRNSTVDNLRLSFFIVRQCLRQVVEDASAAGDLPIHGIVNEVEDPHLMEHYARHGILELPVRYQEPVFPSSDAGPELAIFQPMRLGYLPAVGAAPLAHQQPEVLTQFVLAFLVDHYGLPETHPVVQTVLDSIPLRQLPTGKPSGKQDDSPARR